MSTNYTFIQTVRVVAHPGIAMCRAPQSDNRHTILKQLQSFMAGLDSFLRRPVLLSPPCCPHLNADELAIIGLVAAAQSHQDSELQARASWLVRKDGMAQVLARTRELAATLSIEGIFLDPIAPTPVPARPAPLHTVSGTAEGIIAKAAR